MKSTPLNTLAYLIDETANRLPFSVALIDGRGQWTFAELADETRRVAGGLRTLGIHAGDKVGLWLPNIAHYLIVHLACARLGAVSVSLNTRFRANEMGDILVRADCKALALWPSFKGIPFLEILSDIEHDALVSLQSIITCGHDDTICSLPDSLSGRRIVTYDALAKSRTTVSDCAHPSDGVVVFTTSGTTAAPKLVLHSHESITRHARDVARFFNWYGSGIALLQVVPFCGTFGHAQAMAALAAGCQQVLIPVFSEAESVELMRKHHITHCNGSDEMFAHMLSGSDETLPFPDFQYGGYAAFNPMYRDIVTQAEVRGMRLVGLWGMSELQALYARQDPADSVGSRDRMGGILVSPEARVRIRDVESGRLLSHGETGEIETTGPSQMLGYLGDAQATSSVLSEDGFVRTGDLGYTESDRRFVFVSRMGDAVRLGGYLVNPAEIEKQLEQHAIVDRAQVVTVDTDRGTGFYAFVILIEGCQLEQEVLLEHCAMGIARFKVPVGIQAVADFPVTESANGVKIQKSRLREIALAQLRGN